MANTPQAKITCTACRHTEIWGLEASIRNLIKQGKMKRTAPAEPTIVFELLYALASTFRCSKCGNVGLTAAPHVDEAATDDESDWLEARLCTACRKPIPGERLAAVPSSTLCVTCQSLLDEGHDPGARQEYCPRCGVQMEMRTIHAESGSRYALVCPMPGCRGRID